MNSPLLRLLAIPVLALLFLACAAASLNPALEGMAEDPLAGSPEQVIAAEQDKSPNAPPPKAADPMASFARMIGGEWKVTFASGTSMYDTYHWGPGNHSGRVMTHGQDAAGNPWRGLGVVYWHPALKRVCSLSLNPYEGSVSEGSITVDLGGETSEIISDLYQNGVHRKLVSRDTFDGPDKYHSALLEEVEPGKLTALTEWDYFRWKTLTPVRPLPAENPPKPSERLKALEPLVGRIWDAIVQKPDWREGGGDAVHIESTFEWIPYIDAIYARTFALRGNGVPTHVLDAYFYHHTGTNKLRCLVLSHWGGQSGVYEGDVTVLDAGGAGGGGAVAGLKGLQLDLKGYEGDQAVTRIVRFDFEKDGTLHHRVWSLGGGGSDGAPAERTLTLDVHHTASDMSKSIRNVFQDSNNNYWFGSDEQGVYRYDGKTLTQFTTKDGLPSDRVGGIHEHPPTGGILVSTSEGISKFDGKTFSPLAMPETTSPDSAWRLHPDDLWFGGGQDSGVVYRYDGQTMHRLKFPKTKDGEEFLAQYPRAQFPNMKYSPYDVYAIFRDSKGRMWFGTELGVCCYDGKSFSWISEAELGFDGTGSAFNVRSIIEDSDGRLWFTSTFNRWNVDRNGAAGDAGQGIEFRKEPGIGRPEDKGKDPCAYFISSVKDSHGDLWLASWGAGVWRYDGKSMTHYPVKDGDKDTTVFSIYKDNRGDLWLGTHQAGPYKFNGKTFEKFAPPQARTSESTKRDPYFTPTEAKTTSSMPRVIIRNMREDRAGNIWFATFGGPIRYDGKDFTNFAEEVGLANTRIFSLLEDRSGALWFGSITGGASRYDGKTFTKFTEKEGLAANDVMWIFEDRDANIWFGTNNGASRYDGKSFTNFTTNDGLLDNSVYTIGQDAAGRIWFGTQGGICSYDGKSFSNFADQVGRSFSNIRAMAVDRSGNLWFGGQGGAYRYDGKILTTFTSKDGLVDDFVGSMIVDRAGNVWLGHPGHPGGGGGASRYDGTSFKRFTPKDGLNSANVYAVGEDKAGNIWFGSVDAGACRYDGRTFTNFSAAAQ